MEVYSVHSPLPLLLQFSDEKVYVGLLIAEGQRTKKVGIGSRKLAKYKMTAGLSGPLAHTGHVFGHCGFCGYFDGGTTCILSSFGQYTGFCH